MLQTTSKFAPKYLPFDNFHVAEITGIEPDFLRGSARRLAKDREKIKHTTVLNYICKALGFRGGFSSYQQSHAQELKTFMERHRLHGAGLYDPKTHDRPFQIDLPEISGRCFQSGKNCPTRIFTGADVDWFDLLEAALDVSGFEVKNQFTGRKITDATEIANARRDIPMNWIVLHENKYLSLDACWTLNTLLGDQLLQFKGQHGDAQTSFVGKVYFPDYMEAEEIARDEERYQGAAEMLTRILPKLDRGWVDILRFNKNLIFVRDWTGGYDFVFPQLKKTKFNHNIHKPYLKNADVPKSDDLYHFRRWYFYEYEGWSELDRHNAERHFYEQGNQPCNYPGEEQILRSYFLASGRYTVPSEKASLVEGFREVIIGTKRLAVSDPISVAQFRDFMMQGNELYARYRPCAPQQDDWRLCNQDDDIQGAPASATWYDATAFAAHVSRSRKLPVRLPTEEEWLAITHEFRSSLRSIQVDYEYLNEGRIVEKCKRDEQHQFLGTRYQCEEADLPWEKTKDDVCFLRAIDFGEWLMFEGAAINSLHLGAMNLAPLHLSEEHSSVSDEGDKSPHWEKRVSAERDRMSPRSTGAYKNMRIGFRLVYELA
jgi:hypothetical protein